MRIHKFAVLVLPLALAGCASLEQTEDQVFKRHSGGQLAYWMPVQQGAAMHWPYAWAALAAYQDEYDPKRKPLAVTPACPEPHAYLTGRQWQLWDTLPLLRDKDDGRHPAAAPMRATHLRAEVWSNSVENKVIVAFGGTALTSLQDWKSNLRWLLHPLGSHDAYDVLTEHFVPAFRKEYLRSSMQPGQAWLKTAERPFTASTTAERPLRACARF